MLLFTCILVYAIVLALSIAAQTAEGELKTSSDWVKVIFWPITVVVYFLGLLLWVLIWVPRKIFKGILLCLYEIKDFFVEVFDSAIKK
jgi:hypothetical protein